MKDNNVKNNKQAVFTRDEVMAEFRSLKARSGEIALLLGTLVNSENAETLRSVFHFITDCGFLAEQMVLLEEDGE